MQNKDRQKLIASFFETEVENLLFQVALTDGKDTIQKRFADKDFSIAVLTESEPVPQSAKKWDENLYLDKESRIIWIHSDAFGNGATPFRLYEAIQQIPDLRNQSNSDNTKQKPTLH